MKKIIISLAIAIFLVGCGGLENSVWAPDPIELNLGNSQVLSLTPGSFIGVGTGGFAGDIEVQVTVDSTSIIDIEVTDHSETENFANMVWDVTLPTILATNSTDVDTVSGATMTFNAFVEAVEDALVAAGADLDDIRGGASGSGGVAGNFNPGTYVGVGTGFGGSLELTVVLSETNIISLDITDHSETDAFLERTKNDLIPRILHAQSADVDVTSGATDSSIAILDALRMAMSQASD